MPDPGTMDFRRADAHLAGVALVVLPALALSGIAPYDRITWFMEVMPVLIVFPLLAATRRCFPLTSLLYFLVGLHALILIGGGAYTYARVPAGLWVQELFDLARNPYDKLGHFAQGFVPALAAREILLRGGYVNGPRMLFFLCVCIALAISAVYEMIEWFAGLSLGQGASEFLGTQGDGWDTQSDMFMALIGALCALFALAGMHDRQIAALRQDNP